MPSRHYARELAMQALFGIEVGRTDPGEAIAALVNEKTDSLTRRFVNDLVFGTIEYTMIADQRLEPLLHEWSLDRLPIIDRIVLRMSLFEAQLAEQTPPAVIIDEAVELVKRFSTDDSGRFVNGVLAKALIG